ncbi:coiled-coil domain-containing protein 189 isoform X2 [Meleagris gallopavo]|uniref:coiled-coil domain-containing protein 189 isoform X2 n=1 Tax=Meleagris gallopavo TaxID=9103 RepID=UPI0009400AC4|nr:coiled-coil domain-containing protein 189 isoform X2 [Meleagris gallopavo]
MAVGIGWRPFSTRYMIAVRASLIGHRFQHLAGNLLPGGCFLWRGGAAAAMATAGSREPHSCETRISLWTDLDVVAMERLQAAPTQQDRRAVLAEVLPGPPVLLDAYEAAVELGQELELSSGPLLALLGIVRCAISMCTQTPLPDVEECYAYFSELLLCHAVHVARIAAHLFGNVLRHTKLYAYVLTPQACLDLTLVYVDSPEHGPEGEMPTTLSKEQGETSGNPSTEPLLQEAAVPELVQVPAEMHLSKEDVSVSPRASPRGKKHLRRPQGSHQGNKRR